MDETYKQYFPFDCGIASMAFVRSQMNKTKYEDEYKILEPIWTFPKKDGYLTYLRDFPGAHYRVMSRLKIPWLFIDPKYLLENRLYNQAIVLVHGLMKMKYKIFDQHWCVVKQVLDGKVDLHVGNGKVYSFEFDQFKNLYYQSFPNCMYIMGVGETNQHKIEQFVDWGFSWIA